MKTVRYLSNIFVAGCLVLGSLAFAPVTAVHTASTYIVNTLTDENDHSCSDGDCSLRDAMELAVSGDTITFSVTGTITLSLGELHINQKSLTISGPGSGQLTIDANLSSRIFDIQLVPGPTVYSVSISGMTITNGQVTDQDGGGILQAGGKLTLNDVILTNNTALTSDILAPYAKGGGIAIEGGTLTITNSQVTNNTGVQNGGGVYGYFGSKIHLTNTLVQGNILSASNGGGAGIGVNSDNPAFGLNQSTLTLDGVTVNNNTGADEGTGIWMQDYGIVTINNSTISNNTGVANAGAGVALSQFATLTMTNSTISGNDAGVHDGGGLWVPGSATANLTNVTIANNNANNGAGILAGGTLNLNNVTISGNSASSQGGGIYYGAGTTKLKNTILSANTAASSGPNCYGTLNSQDYNLIEDVSGCTLTGTTTHNITGTDPDLVALADNGGATKTMALPFGSAAIDKGSNTTCAVKDQRGFSRPFDGDVNGTAVCDIGAFESSGLTVINLKDSGAGSLRQALLDVTDGKIIDATRAVGTIVLKTPLTVTNTVTNVIISGPGATKLFISGNNLVRVFNIQTGAIVTISGLTIKNGHVVDSNGAGITNDGTLTLKNVVVTANRAVKLLNSTVSGGGIYNTNVLTVMNSTISLNVADYRGGGIYSTGSSLTMSNVKITGNTALGTGGGGGLYLEQGSSSTLNDLSITGNMAKSGGGVYSAGSFSLRNSLVASNKGTSTDTGGMVLADSTPGTYSLSNVTVTGNTTKSLAGATGTGIRVYLGTLDLNNVTINKNLISGGAQGSGLYVDAGATVNLMNTIIAKNGSLLDPNPDCSGTLNSQDYNLIKNVTGCTINGTTTNNIIGQDPLLKLLANNSGSTLTEALTYGSPAIDAGNDGTCAASDQRGIARPQLGIVGGLTPHCDIGAFEYQMPTVKTLKAFVSVASLDGYVTESAQASGVGGTKYPSGATFTAGDDTLNRQNIGILYFGTAGLPDNAVIYSVQVKVKPQSMLGTPFSALGNLRVDIKKPFFGSSAILGLDDFAAVADHSDAGESDGTLTSSLYAIPLDLAANSFVNRTGSTQLRLYFATPTNADNIANYLMLYSGESLISANRPRLEIQYFLP